MPTPLYGKSYEKFLHGRTFVPVRSKDVTSHGLLFYLLFLLPYCCAAAAAKHLTSLSQCACLMYDNIRMYVASCFTRNITLPTERITDSI